MSIDNLLNDIPVWIQEQKDQLKKWVIHLLVENKNPALTKTNHLKNWFGILKTRKKIEHVLWNKKKHNNRNQNY